MPIYHITAEDRSDDNHVSTYFVKAKTPAHAAELFYSAEYTAGLTITQIVTTPAAFLGYGMIPWERLKAHPF